MLWLPLLWVRKRLLGQKSKVTDTPEWTVETPMISVHAQPAAAAVGYISMSSCIDAYLQIIRDTSLNGNQKRRIPMWETKTSLLPLFISSYQEMFWQLQVIALVRQWSLDPWILWKASWSSWVKQDKTLTDTVCWLTFKYNDNPLPLCTLAPLPIINKHTRPAFVTHFALLV